MNATTTATTVVIPMIAADTYRTEHYGVLFSSAFVYRVGNASPVRIDIWDNVRRPNKRNGEQVRFSNYGKIDGGHGVYLDPENNATDEERTFMLNPESSVISAHGDGTGTVASGQVFDPAVGRLTAGQVVTLAFIDGTTRDMVLRPTNYGHGRLVAVEATA